MRNNGYQLVKIVARTSGATKVTTLATYEDRGTKYSFIDDSGNLAYRIAQACDRELISRNVSNVLENAFSTDGYEIPAYVTQTIAHAISDSDTGFGLIIRTLDTEGLTYIPVTRDASEYDGYTAQIVGEYFNAKGQHKGFRIVVNGHENDPVDVASTRRRVAFKCYGLSTLYGTFVKKPLAAYALKEAQELTKALNTANTYHHVKYRFTRADVGEAV